MEFADLMKVIDKPHKVNFDPQFQRPVGVRGSEKTSHFLYSLLNLFDEFCYQNSSQTDLISDFHPNRL